MRFGNRTIIGADGKRLRVGDRITKAGEAAIAHFNKLVESHLEQLGAVRTSSAPWRDWSIETIHGTLGVSSHGNWIAQVFADWPRAKAAGFGHWKWNFHYDLGAAEAEVDNWKRALERILPHRGHEWTSRPSTGGDRLRSSACRRCHMVTDFMIPFRLQYQNADGTILGMLDDEPACQPRTP